MSYFILATTEVHKVPGDDTSRCQRFDFRPHSAGRHDREAGSDMPGGRDQRRTKKALHSSPGGATGSLRDAENLLERLVVYHGPA